MLFRPYEITPLVPATERMTKKRIIDFCIYVPLGVVLGYIVVRVANAFGLWIT